MDGVAGPDNRLDQQAKASANLAADYRFRGLLLTLGGNFNWVPATRTQLADAQVVSVGSKKIFDVYGLWTFNPSLALRLLASNLTLRDYLSVNQVDALGLRTLATTTTPTDVRWQTRLEIKL